MRRYIRQQSHFHKTISSYFVFLWLLMKWGRWWKFLPRLFQFSPSLLIYLILCWWLQKRPNAKECKRCLHLLLPWEMHLKSKSAKLSLEGQQHEFFSFFVVLSLPLPLLMLNTLWTIWRNDNLIMPHLITFQAVWEHQKNQNHQTRLFPLPQRLWWTSTTYP